MNILTNMQVRKERYRVLNVRRFPDTLRDRLWKIKAECMGKVTLEDIVVQAVEEGLPSIEKRTGRRVPDFVEDPKDE